MKVLSMAACRRWRNQQGRRLLLRPALSSMGAMLLLCSLLVLLSACTNYFATPTQTGTPSTDTTISSVTATPNVSPTAVKPVLPTITLQVSGCPTLAINWDKLVGTRANVNKVQKVFCGALEGSGTLDALVDVRYYSSDAKLDYYVYNNLFGTPNRLVSTPGLLNGDAFISSVGTIVTAAVNPNDTIKGPVDLFKEYQWNGTAFGQVIFPGMYPDMTRYQSEQAQTLVNAEIAALQPGQSQAQIRDSWRLAAGSVVARLTRNIFHWTNFTVTLPLHAPKLTILPITVTNLAAGGGGFVATVHHLNEVVTNIFEVWQVDSINGNAAISSPAAYAQLTNPAKISGSSVVTGNVVGQVVLYDDTYTMVGDSGAIRSSATSGSVPFTSSVSYHLNGLGLEEGVVAFYPTYQNNIALSGQAILVKVFLAS